MQLGALISDGYAECLVRAQIDQKNVAHQLEICQECLMRKLEEFPEISVLKRRMQSLAILDALLCPEWDLRYFSYNNDWNVDEAMGSIRNGSGDEVFALFSNAGCFIKEYYHERPVHDDAYILVPLEFCEAAREPAFSPENITTCYWRTYQSGDWRTSGKEDEFNPEANFLLAALDGKPETYEVFAEEYYEQNLPLGLVAQFFKHNALTTSIADSLGYTGKLKDLKNDALEIGYPSSLAYTHK